MIYRCFARNGKNKTLGGSWLSVLPDSLPAPFTGWVGGKTKYCTVSWASLLQSEEMWLLYFAQNTYFDAAITDLGYLSPNNDVKFN
jgi:hypothetical protein